MLFDAVDRGLDELGQIAHHPDFVAGRREGRDLGQAFPDGVDDLDGIGARLTADGQHDAGLAVEVRRGLRFGHPVFDRRDVAQQHLMAVALADDDVAESLDRLHAPARPQGHRRGALFDAPAGNLGVLGLNRARDVGDRQVLRPQPVGVDEDVDLAGPAAHDDDLADAADAFELTAERLVRVLGDVADRRVGRDRERHHRRRVGIELLDHRLFDRAWQEREHAVDAVAHLLRRHVAVLLEQERDDDLRDALGGVRAQLVDAADRVDGLLDLVADLGFDLLRRGARQPGRDHDGGEVDLREAVEPKLREGEGADDGQRRA